MRKLKTYTTPTTLYVIGTIMFEKEDEELCVRITDDYSGGVVRGNKSTDALIETDGAMTVCTFEQLEHGLNSIDAFDLVEDCGIIEFVNFTGDVYVSLSDEDGKDWLKEDADLEDYLMYEYSDDYPEEGLYLDVVLLFSGEYGRSIRKNVKDFEYLIKETNE